MPKLVGSIAALVALAAGILGRVDGTACLTRAAIAFFAGWFGCTIWFVFFMGQMPTPKESKKK